MKWWIALLLLLCSSAAFAQCPGVITACPSPTFNAATINTMTLGGSPLVLTPAHSITITLQGTTNVTMPTSGTLLTQATLPLATSSSVGVVQPDNTTITINGSGIISSTNSGSVSGPGSSTSGNVPQWSGSTGTVLTNGLPVGTTGNNTIVETSSGGLIAASILPTPTASTLGGIESYVAVSHQWINAISTGGVPSSTQPAFTDITGQTTLVQLPTLSANTVLGAVTGTTPSGLAVPSCSGTSNALQWTSGTGFGCGSITGGGGGGSANVEDFLAGTNYTPGTTTSLTLSSTPINAASTTIYFDGVRQSANTWSLATATVTFNAAIPLSTQVVEAWWGTVSGSSTPPGGSNTDVQFNSSGSFAGNGGFTYDSTSKITLGTAGSSAGTIGFNNATSGQVSLTVPTGALGTVTLTLPDVTDTVTANAAAQTLTNKTMSGASNTFSALALSSLATQAANTVVANSTGSIASPTASTVPSCSTSQSALTWVAGSGFGCNTLAGAPGGPNGSVQYNSTGNLNGVAGFTFDGGSVITVGQAGTSLGGVKFSNSTSGFVELVATTGALGTSVLTLPAATDTVALLAAAQTLTNKSIAGSEINSGTVAGQFGGTGVANTGHTITIGGNVTMSGAFTFTGTLTNTTAVTFPTSGTLLTTTGNGSGLTGLTYTQLPSLGANQVLGALTATTPSGLTVPSCAAANSALTWTSGSGFGCNALPTTLLWSNVVSFGADPTGVASSSTAIASAYAATTNVFFPCGTYKITSAIAPPSNSQALGAAYGCVTITETGLSSGTVGMFDISTSTNNVAIYDIICGSYASGSCVWNHGGQTMYLDWVGCNGTLGACILLDSNTASSASCSAGGCDVQYHIAHLQVNAAIGGTLSASSTTEGVDVGAHGTEPVAGVYLDKPNIMNATDCGIRFVNVSGAMITGPGEIFNNAKDVCTFPGSGQVNFSIFISDVFADATTSGANYSITTNGGTVDGFHVSNVWANSATTHGVLISPGTGTIVRADFTGGSIGGGTDAVCIQGGQMLAFNGVKVNGSGSASNTYNGYTINGAGAAHVQITGGNTGSPTIAVAAQQFAGIWIGNGTGAGCAAGSAGNPDYIAVTGVDTTGNVSTGIDLVVTPTHYSNVGGF